MQQPSVLVVRNLTIAGDRTFLPSCGPQLPGKGIEGRLAEDTPLGPRNKGSSAAHPHQRKKPPNLNDLAANFE